jgi:UDP-2,4-diacetamido-2,4,6-trideoxy-beta-L-altropyranose hydrolase
MSSRKPQIVIRADASESIGTGHVMRMVALAQALRARSASVTFAVHTCPEPLLQRLRAQGFEIVQLSGSNDAQETVRLAKACDAAWVITDGYAFDHAFQTTVRVAGIRLLCVDDHGYCDDWAADALLNQNLHAAGKRAAYAVPLAMLGTDFALLREEFWRKPVAHEVCEHQRVLVTMGGVDPPNATRLIAEALALVSLPHLRVTVLMGRANPHRASVEAICAQHPQRFELLDGVERMSSLLEEMDAVITAGGSTCWEVLWAGKPAAVLVIADNQQPIADALATQGLMLALGRCEALSVPELAARLETWLLALPTVSPAQRMDGKGARRVAAVLDGKFSITIATAGEGWLRSELDALKTALETEGHRVVFASKSEEMKGGDFLLLLSYWGIVPPSVLGSYLHSLVVHASDLPNGRGWSPATWRILEGQSVLPICLLEAEEKVDRGDIYYRDAIVLEGHELIAEWREQITRKTIELCLRFIHDYPQVLARRERQPDTGSCYARRTPADSQLDPSKTLEQLFNLLRVADNAAYPAFFDYLGYRYLLKIEKASP